MPLAHRQRRAHEALSRRDTVTLASTWSPAGISTNDNFRASDNPQRRAQSQNVQMAMWDHALGEEPSRNGSTLSVYGRVLFGGQERSNYAQSMGTGLGLRYDTGFGPIRFDVATPVAGDTGDGVQIYIGIGQAF